MVTSNDWRCGYGIEIYPIGVFFDEEKANKAARKNEGKVTAVETDKIFPLLRDSLRRRNKQTDYHLGGYTE